MARINTTLKAKRGQTFSFFLLFLCPVQSCSVCVLKCNTQAKTFKTVCLERETKVKARAGEVWQHSRKVHSDIFFQNRMRQREREGGRGGHFHWWTICSTSLFLSSLKNEGYKWKIKVSIFSLIFSLFLCLSFECRSMFVC